MQKIIKKVKEMILSLDPSKKYFVGFHFDIDGCASASLLWRFFQKEHIQSEFFPVTEGFEPMCMDKISAYSPDEIILLDYPPRKELVEYIKRYKTHIFDHHLHEEMLDQFNYFTCHDMGTSVSVSYYLSETLQKMGFESIDWLGRVGAFWDKIIEFTKFNYEGIYQSEIETMLPFNLVVNFTNLRGAQRIFKTFNESSSFEEALEKTQALYDYAKAKKTFDAEFKEILKSKKEFKEIKLAVYNIKTKFKHIRIYVDYISFPSEITNLFILNENTRYKISLRTHLEINLVKIVKELSKNNPSIKGGGHKKACGAMLLGHSISDFTKPFIELYKAELKENGL